LRRGAASQIPLRVKSDLSWRAYAGKRGQSPRGREARARSGLFRNQPKEIAAMKNSLDKQAFKLGVIAVVLATIFPVLAEQMLSGQATPAALAAVSGAVGKA
jgi:hypothetical protein